MNLKDYKLVYESAVLKTFMKDGVKVQIIYRDYDSISATLDSFDFTITQFACNEDIEFFCNAEALVHLYERKLVVHLLNTKYVVDSLRRMQKYIQKGFTICDGGLKDFVEAIRIASPDEVENAFKYYTDTQNPRIVRFD